MTEKRFKLDIEWYNKEKTDGEVTLNEMGQPLGVIESIEDARLIRDILNEMYDENEQLKQSMKKAYIILKEADLFSDKATTHDTIAYKELLKLDNKDAYSIANSIKEAMKILKENGENE